jgi:hypothetical protein
MKPLKIILCHAAIWTLWYALNSLSLITTYQMLTGKDWLLIAYNYLSIITFFYCILFVMESFFYGFSWFRYQRLKTLQKIRYIVKIQHFIVLGVIAMYIAVSVWMDNSFSGYKANTIFLTIDRRFTRLSAYVLLAIGYAHYRTYKKRQQGLRQARNKAYKHLQKKTLRFNELDAKIDDEVNLN